MTGLGQTYFAAPFEDNVLETERGAQTRRTRTNDAHVDVLRDPLYARRVKRLSPPRHCDMEGFSSSAQRDTTVALQCHVTPPAVPQAPRRRIPGR